MKKIFFLFCLIPFITFSQCISGDCKNGPGVYLWENGDKFEGEFVNGQPEGKGSYNFIEGDKYVGQFKDGFFHGEGILYYAEGDSWEGEWYEGEMLCKEMPCSFSEDDVRRFLDFKDNIDPCEGIYRYQNSDPKIESQYQFLIIKENYKYLGYIMSANCIGCQWWKIGDVKFEMTEGSIDGFFDVRWKFPKKQKVRDNQIIFYSELNGALITNKANLSLIKLYPKFDNNFSRKRLKTGEWSGNGSGIIISKSGYIITNHHVIDNADEIEVEFILDNEVQKFNAEIVQVDKTNDLAVIKIVDMNFDGVDNLPYNFKTRSSDVGTKVYAYGYPMALSIMGKEIKVTDGIISSKTGFDGNITTYQITAPIQGGNSGGPLFDDKGNLIGINSSGISKDIADNVGYSIKSNYILNLIDILPKSIDLPSSQKLADLPLTEQIKQITKYVVLVKVK